MSNGRIIDVLIVITTRDVRKWHLRCRRQTHMQVIVFDEKRVREAQFQARGGTVRAASAKLASVFKF